FISSPSIKVNYRNSFAVPIELTLAVSGSRESETVNLGLAPFVLASPSAPGERDKAGAYVIDKNNSSLPALVSLPPEIIRYSGSARMNPQTASNVRNNYVFGNSRFIASMEIEVPLEFRINNLQFADTVENFMKSDGGDDDSQFSPDDFEYVRVELKADNGFPLGVSASMSLYDPVTSTVKSTVNATDILKPAPAGSDGRANGSTETATTILFTEEFLDSVDTSDEIIFRFTLNTTDGATRNIKIYSDYRINFRAALIVKPDINLK
ncbi:MAG: hypothetical protein MUE32_05125, partial [Bacteroidales bacterium]|nr:hypothetical protein [Bacteroidales bacterium]